MISSYNAIKIDENKETIKNSRNRYKVNINSNNNPDYTNRISTSLYTWYNCFPKILIQQFKKTANIYFLVIALMQVNFK